MDPTLTETSSAPGSEADTPLVSVVIPARNEEAYLGAALASVAAQRYPLDRLECVVSDNGSTDRTARVAAAFAQQNPTLSVSLETEPVPGVGRAKNRGAAAARGEILLFLDADSCMDPDLARDVAAAWRAGCPAGSIKIVADSRHPLDRGFFALMELGKVLFGIRSQMMYCDRGLFLSLGGFDPNLHLAEDLDFLKRAQDRVREAGLGTICHVRTSAIRTSPRRLRSQPLRLGMIAMFARWALAFMGLGRTRRY